MSARQIKKSYISCVGYFKSYKNNNQLAFESILERDFFTILEFDKNVVAYKEQPFTLRYKLNSVNTKYTPDVLVDYEDGSQKVFEVKYQDEINANTELQDKLANLKNEIKKQKNLVFEIFTDEDLNDIYLNNCMFLYKFAFLNGDEVLHEKVISEIANLKSPIPVKTFAENITNSQNEYLTILPYIWHELFKNNSLIAMREKITMNSTILSGDCNG